MKINKAAFERFISKYSLGGTIEQVEWVASATGIYTAGAPDSRSVVAMITAFKLEMDPGTYNVYNTSQLRSLLGCLGDEFDLVVKMHQGQPKEFILKDIGSKVTFSLADPQAMPLKPAAKPLPVPEVKMSLDGKFYKAFAKAKSALGGETFTVQSNGQTCEIILSDFANNSVTLTPETMSNGKMKPVHFSSTALYDILSVNKENEKGIIEVSSKGIAHVLYESDEFVAKYYLFQDMTKLT
jgi:hypothetical protein